MDATSEVATQAQQRLWLYTAHARSAYPNNYGKLLETIAKQSCNVQGVRGVSLEMLAFSLVDVKLRQFSGCQQRTRETFKSAKSVLKWQVSFYTCNVLVPFSA